MFKEVKDFEIGERARARGRYERIANEFLKTGYDAAEFVSECGVPPRQIYNGLKMYENRTPNCRVRSYFREGRLYLTRTDKSADSGN